jgi:acyl carrier protein
MKITGPRENNEEMTQDQFLEVLTKWVRANKQTADSFKITPDTELLGSGLLDSFDFLDLIVHIETQTGHKIDLAVADPNEFSIVRGLWNLTHGDGGTKIEPKYAAPKSELPAGITQ